MDSESEVSNLANCGAQLGGSAGSSKPDLLREPGQQFEDQKSLFEKTAAAYQIVGASPNPHITTRQKGNMASKGRSMEQTNVSRVPTVRENTKIARELREAIRSAMAERQTVVEGIRRTQPYQQAVQSRQTPRQDRNAPSINGRITVTVAERRQIAAEKSQDIILGKQRSSSKPVTMNEEKSWLTTSQLPQITHEQGHPTNPLQKPPPTALVPRSPQLMPAPSRLLPFQDDQTNPTPNPNHFEPSEPLIPMTMLSEATSHKHNPTPQDTNANLPAAILVCIFPNCGRTYSKKVGLRNHRVAAHPESYERRFSCQVEGCGKVYALSSTLKVHIKTKHPGQEKVYICDLEAIADDGKGSDGEGSSSKVGENMQCGKPLGTFAALKMHRRTAHRVWKCWVGNCQWKGHSRHALTAHRKREHQPESLNPEEVKVSDPASKVAKFRDGEPARSEKLAWKGSRLEPIVSNKSEGPIKADVYSDQELPQAKTAMDFESAEETTKSIAPDSAYRDVTEGVVGRHWIGTHPDLTSPISTPSRITAQLTPLRRIYVPAQLRQSQALPAAYGNQYVIPNSKESSQHAPFTRVNGDEISESPQPQAPAPACQPGTKPQETPHDTKQVRFAIHQTSARTKNVMSIKEPRIESAARETEKIIVPDGLAHYQTVSSKGPRTSQLSGSSIDEHGGLKGALESNFPAEPISRGKKLGARAFGNLNHAALRGDEEELLPTPGRRYRTPSLSPEPSITSSAPPSPELFVSRSTAPATKVESAYNSDHSDSEMSSGPENPRIPRKTITTAANSKVMDPDAVMRFPNEMSNSPTKHAAQNRAPPAPRSKYITAPAVEASDSDDDFVRGRYMGKDRKREYSKFRPNSLFIPDPSKEAQVAFHTSTEIGSKCSQLLRGSQTLLQAAGNQAGSGSGSGSGDAAALGGNLAGVRRVVGGKRKKATCSGPARVKRQYIWRDGGKRATQAGIQAKIQAKKAEAAAGAGRDGDGTRDGTRDAPA